MTEILQRIEEACIKNGISAAEMCRRIGISPGSITEWRAGRNTSYLKKIYQIADVLGTTPEALRGEEPLTQPQAQSAPLTPDGLDGIRQVITQKLPALNAAQLSAILGVITAFDSKN